MRVFVTPQPASLVAGDVLVGAFFRAKRGKVPLKANVRPDASKWLARGEDAVTWFDTRDAKAGRALIVSLGELPPPAGGRDGEAGSYGARERTTALRQRARSLGALIERACRAAGLRRIALAELPPEIDPALVVEGILLSAHRTTRWQTVPSSARLERIAVLVSDGVDTAQREALATRVADHVRLAEKTNIARELADMPANHGDPVGFATAILDHAEDAGLGTLEITASEAERMGMGLFCAVASGGAADGRLLVLEYYPDGFEKKGKTPPLLGLVGKGVTHDLGGYNLKRKGQLHAMTYDKAGAAAIAGAMLAIAEIAPPVHVIAVLAIAQNALDRPAYKPGDVLTAMDGTTVFVDNTDAEGRLMMADALCWLAQFQPSLVVDVATLTGAANVALGEPFAALFANDDDAATLVADAARKAGDPVWPMPIHDLHDREIGHYKADLRNAHTGFAQGAASIAAAFLRQFVTSPWAHVDFGGKANWESPRDVLGTGATGFGTRLLVELTLDFAKRHDDSKKS